jgi:hypothetical protein
MIGKKLNDARLPPHVYQRIEDRIQQEAGKDAAFDVERYQALAARLEYADLREVQDTIFNKSLWGVFQSRFLNKDVLASKFDRLATLRNCIRHSRRADEVTLKEGEAAILWFEQVLWK